MLDFRRPDLQSGQRNGRFDRQVRAALRPQRAVQVLTIEDSLFVKALSGDVQAMLTFLVSRTKNLPPEERWKMSSDYGIDTSLIT